MSKGYGGRDQGVLLPCPFCGGKPKMIEGDLGHGFWIECEDCMSGTRIGNRREIPKLWNQRKAVHTDEERLEEFIEKVYEFMKKRKEEEDA